MHKHVITNNHSVSSGPKWNVFDCHQDLVFRTVRKGLQDGTLHVLGKGAGTS